MNAGTTADGADTVLAIENLAMSVHINGKQRTILHDINLRVGRGETVGVVGESGSGKSLTSRTAVGLFPPNSTVTGSVLVDGHQTIGARQSALRKIRRDAVSMIFQDPRGSVNPVRRVGDFLIEGLTAKGTPRAEARRRAIELLTEVGIRDPAGALTSFPHEFSGGMLQRIVIAGALSTDPLLLLADEATTALDVTTQAEVVGLLLRLQQARGMGLLFVTHDLELAAAICNRIYVMQGGQIVETGETAQLFANPQHPYTLGLLHSSPRLTDDEWIHARAEKVTP